MAPEPAPRGGRQAGKRCRRLGKRCRRGYWLEVVGHAGLQRHAVQIVGHELHQERRRELREQRPIAVLVDAQGIALAEGPLEAPAERDGQAEGAHRMRGTPRKGGASGHAARRERDRIPRVGAASRRFVISRGEPTPRG